MMAAGKVKIHLDKERSRFISTDGRRFDDETLTQDR
jgi:hypothetical protein